MCHTFRDMLWKLEISQQENYSYLEIITDKI
jgi:hypothetical protein